MPTAAGVGGGRRDHRDCAPYHSTPGRRLCYPDVRLGSHHLRVTRRYLSSRTSFTGAANTADQPSDTSRMLLSRRRQNARAAIRSHAPICWGDTAVTGTSPRAPAALRHCYDLRSMRAPHDVDTARDRHPGSTAAIIPVRLFGVHAATLPHPRRLAQYPASRRAAANRQPPRHRRIIGDATVMIRFCGLVLDRSQPNRVSCGHQLLATAARVPAAVTARACCARDLASRRRPTAHVAAGAWPRAVFLAIVHAIICMLRRQSFAGTIISCGREDRPVSTIFGVEHLFTLTAYMQNQRNVRVVVNRNSTVPSATFAAVSAYRENDGVTATSRSHAAANQVR